MCSHTRSSGTPSESRSNAHTFTPRTTAVVETKPVLQLNCTLVKIKQ